MGKYAFTVVVPAHNEEKYVVRCIGSIKKAAEYFGKPVLKPTIGDADRPAERKDIRLAVRLLYITAFLMMAVIAVIGLL